MIDFIKKLFSPGTDFSRLINDGAVVVDVRTTGEYQAGHIKESKNIPLDSVKARTGVLKNLNKPVITVCRSGKRSGIARSILANAGIEAYNGGPWTNIKKLMQ